MLSFLLTRGRKIEWFRFEFREELTLTPYDGYYDFEFKPQKPRGKSPGARKIVPDK